MSDSPFYKAPIDPAEKPILDNLVHIRDSLELLKADKSKYIRSQDVVSYYEKLIDQVHDLNDIRTTKRDEQNRLDVVLDDCLQLISLFFLTIGRNNEAPAAYSVTSSIKRLLDHLKEAGYYSPKDLGGISNELDRIEHSVEQGNGKHNEHMLLLLRTRVNNCKATLAELRQGLSSISPELMPIFERLVSILRSLSGLNLVKSKFPIDEVKDYQRQLKDIEKELGAHEAPSSESSLEDQYLARLSHVDYTEKSAYKGKDLVVDFLGRVMLWSEIMMQRKGHIEDRFKDKVDELYKIRAHLEKLHLTQAWSLRETDLWSYQRRLDRIDEARVNGMFVDADGKPADLYEQRAMLYLLRKSYATIYHMITSSEPVSEALLPIYNQLLTLRKCLFEVKNSGGVSSARELYPYSMKLNSIDNMRHDGKFIVNGDIPEGQGSVTSLLSECFEVAYELRADAEREEAEDDDEDEDDEEAVRMKLEQARLEEEESGDVVPEMTEVDGDEVEEDEEDGGGLVRTESRRAK